jgi:DNA-binding phage protein
MNATAAPSHYGQDESRSHDELRVEAFEIGSMMKRSGLPDHFIAKAVDLSEEFSGILELMRMWRDESNAAEREATVADIQELLDDCSQSTIVEAAYVRFDDLDRIASNVRAFKDSLRLIVDERGGIGQLAEKTGIPQPSLSRFFNNAAMPRRTTLLRIARALNLNQVQIAPEWCV